jgi:hypothetical protein
MPNPSRRVLGANLAPLPVECLITECDANPVADAPVALCIDHIRQAFGYYLRHAQDDLSANEPEPYELDEQEQRRNPGTLDVSGFVYFALFGDRIKIGWSANPTTRLRSIPHDEVLALMPGTMRNERQCHEAFAHLRVTGEWFEAAPDLMSFIDRLTAA